MLPVTEIYRHTKHFPRDEVFGLTVQMRRAAVSIASNIAEGKGRASGRELVQFLGHARGSLYEVQAQLRIAQELGYLSRTEGQELIEQAAETGRILAGLIRSFSKAAFRC
jgi:four helix bundle protein